MATITQLPPGVVNKIAAGEVIDRPASVVKELVENSLDAGASRVEVTVERGGSELIRVADDGCGIAADELRLAVAPHATSKIRDADDLFRVSTLGFRGEALASIAEVSQFRLISRPADCDAGAMLEVHGGRIDEVVPCGSPPGTTIEVRTLFVNTPVRRKFLRTTQTEMGHVGDAVVRLALAHPEVHFSLAHQKRRVYDLPAGESWLARIARLFGGELADQLIPVESEDGGVRLSGYVASPNHSRGNQRMQFLLVNGRFIRDRALQHALSEAYRGLLMHGRFPIAFLRLEMSPEAVDVNVHPTKLEVRFQDSGRIYSQLLGTLRTRFLTADLSTSLDPSRAAVAREAEGAGDPADDARRELVEWAQAEMARNDTPRGISPEAPPLKFGDPETGASDGLLTLNRLPRAWTPAEAKAEEQRRAAAEALYAFAPRPEASTSSPGDSAEAADESSSRTSPAGGVRGGRALQVHNRYLIAENEEGVLVIDQHALHERILYEQLRDKILSGAVESQALLVPEPVDLAPSEAAAVLEQRELLARLGMKIEPFGGDTVLLTSFPAMLANLKPDDVVRSMAAQLAEGGKPPDRRDLLDELLHSMSCKAAIKAGDRLTPEEIDALLEQRHLVQDSHHCPHGRPTSLVFTREELDRQFKRT